MIKFQPCACPPAKMTRVHRSTWMRAMFPSRALYQCGTCGGQFLATVGQQTEMGLRAQAERVQSRRAPLHEEARPAPLPSA